MKPTPTDFLGVRFRSRSEAMFALSLVRSFEAAEKYQREWAQENRIVRIGSAGFQYEPRTWIEDWTPDFLTWNVVPPRVQIVDHDVEDVIPMPAINIEFIEYKPSRPSQAYIERFVSKAEQWFRHPKNELQRAPHPYQFRIYYGSPYLDDRASTCGVIVCIPSGTHSEMNTFVHDCKHDWTSQELLEYRFDLADGGVPCSR